MSSIIPSESSLTGALRGERREMRRGSPRALGSISMVADRLAARWLINDSCCALTKTKLDMAKQIHHGCVLIRQRRTYVDKQIGDIPIAPRPLGEREIHRLEGIIAEREEAERRAAAEAEGARADGGATPADFIPSNKFVRVMPGMQFRQGPQGLGYYAFD